MPTLSSVVLEDSPIAYWPMNETSGTTFADASGNGRSATLNGGITLADTTGPCDGSGRKAPRFNGASNTHASTATDNVFRLNGSFTVEMWWRNSGTSNADALCGFGGPGTSEAGGWRLNFLDTAGSLGWNTRRDSQTSSKQSVDDKSYDCFRHLIWRYDETNVLGQGANRSTIWRDGTQTSALTYAYPDLSDTSAFSMARNGVTNVGFDGWLCNVAIYDAPLSDTLIGVHWETGSCPGTCGGVSTTGWRIGSHAI